MTITLSRPAAHDVETELRERIRMFLGDRRFMFADRERQRHEQQLRADAVVRLRGLQFFVGDAFVRGVHVDQHETVRVFREHVHARELRERVAERRDSSIRHAGVDVRFDARHDAASTTRGSLANNAAYEFTTGSRTPRRNPS